MVVCCTQGCLSNPFKDRHQDFLTGMSGPCTEKQPVEPCLTNHRFESLYQVSCNLLPCIQMKCQDKDIKISSPATFPSENPSICWKKPACSGPWSLGWFCKTERHSKKTNAPNSLPFPLPHHPTLGPRKNHCNNHQERKIWWLPEQVSLFSSFPRWTAKSSHVFECVGFGMIYRLDFLLLMSIWATLGLRKTEAWYLRSK